MCFIPEEQILGMMYFILSHQNSTERPLSNPVSAIPALSGELDLKTSAGLFQLRFSSEASISPVWLSPSSTSKLAQTLCWALAANSSSRFGRILRIALGNDI